MTNTVSHSAVIRIPHPPCNFPISEYMLSSDGEIDGDGDYC
jgi:hypothetical protein